MPPAPGVSLSRLGCGQTLPVQHQGRWDLVPRGKGESGGVALGEGLTAGVFGVAQGWGDVAGDFGGALGVGRCCWEGPMRKWGGGLLMGEGCLESPCEGLGGGGSCWGVLGVS